MKEKPSVYRDPEALVQTDWLEAHLGDPDLRIFDCTTYLLPTTDPKYPYSIKSGREDYAQGHIPGADFLDLQGELSDKMTLLRFMLPSEEQFVEAMGRHGVGEGTRVVLYSANHIMWATRIWWMLRAFGFDAGAVLDGGWEKWRDEGRPISIEPCQYPPAQFVPRRRSGLFVDKQAVFTALDDPQVCLLNALRPEYHKGEDPSRYGRAGRIPGSVNVPGRELTRPDTYEFISMAEACARFEAVGAKKEKRIIAYCGGGIAATVDLFLLHQLGYEEIALYDASLGEWAQDESLPLETG